MTSITELLRSPPFPGVKPASIVLAGRHAGALPDPARARAIAKALATARVGGNFWGRSMVGRDRLIVASGGGTLPAGRLDDAVVVTKRSGCHEASARGALVVGPEVDPWPLIEAAKLVQVDPHGEIGVLALAAGRSVTGFDGTAWTDEEGALFDRWLLAGRCYCDPTTGKAIEAEEVIPLLVGWRATIEANRGIVAAAGVAFWKRREVARMLWDGIGTPAFRSPTGALALASRRGGAVTAWPSRVQASFAETAASAGVPVRWIEDGFLRSAGLGSDLHPPMSIIVDDLRPYFDPAGPSRLECLLESDELGPRLAARGAALREAIVAGRIGKYRAGGGVEAISLPNDRPTVLVIGQVEDDLSMLRGGGDVGGNLDLLRRVRASEPEAFVIFRPHPDVEAGHRAGAIADDVALRLADRVMRGGTLDALLERVDRVHVLTSLTGFEALLRGRTVVVHGTPFYAGWGLTVDRGPPVGRRTRRLDLDQLVAGALILYPRYLDPRRGLPCTPEAFVAGLKGETPRASWLVRIRRWQGRIRRKIAQRGVIR